MQQEPTKTDEDRTKRPSVLFYGIAIALTGLCLWPIWHYEFLPMQDYPQHLFLSYVLTNIHNTALNIASYYQTDLSMGPYSFFYAFMKLFSGFLPIEAAGKAFVSLYVILGFLIVFYFERRYARGREPWGTLLVFPFLFHQLYYLGLMNYLASVPVLIIALMAMESLNESPLRTRTIVFNAICVAALFFIHPFTIVAYVGLAGAGALMGIKNRPQFLRMMILPAALGIAFLVWYVSNIHMQTGGDNPFIWFGFKKTASFYLLMFTGMHWVDGVNKLTVIVWAVSGAAILAYMIKGRAWSRIPRRFTLYFVIAILGYSFLPLWVGAYSYFNSRFAPISFLLIAVMAGFIRIPRAVGIVLSGLMVVLILNSITLHGKLSVETATIKPVLEEMKPNARVLPLPLKIGTRSLDPLVYYRFHQHEFFYYHIRRGGGANPYLFPSEMLPVKFREGVDLPKAEKNFSWDEQGSHYDYILVMGGNNGLDAYLRQRSSLTAVSGKWRLYSVTPLNH